MRTISTEIDINASPERVWAILTDLESYPEWNPFITKISGTLVGGHRLKIRIEPPGGKPMEFKPLLTRVLKNKGISWLGSVHMSGVFDGEHNLTIEEIPGNKCRFIQSENFTGIFVSFMFDPIELNTREGFEKMNIALKKRAESEFVVKSPEE